jgi:hypothetical protein
MDILSEPPHLPMGRLLFIKPERPFNEFTDGLSGRQNPRRLGIVCETVIQATKTSIQLLKGEDKLLKK